MRWPLVRPGKIDASAVLQGSEGRLMATSENVGPVSDTRLAAATEEIDFTVRNMSSHVGRTWKAPWASFNKATQTVQGDV